MIFQQRCWFRDGNGCFLVMHMLIELVLFALYCGRVGEVNHLLCPLAYKYYPPPLVGVICVMYVHVNHC